MPVNITEVRLRRVEGGNRTRAVASITFDDAFVIHEVKLVGGREGQDYVAMPSRRLDGGEHLDIAHPVNTPTREYIQRELVQVYDQAVAEGRREYRAFIRT